MANSGQKVVLITGCSSGIGLRIAVMLAKDEKKRYHGKCAFFTLFSLRNLIGLVGSKLFSSVGFTLKVYAGDIQ